MQQLYDVTGKKCCVGGCGHPAYLACEWALGHFGGYECVCCIRKMWEESLERLTESLQSLPDECIGGGK